MFGMNAQRWERIAQRGFWHFALVRGVVAFGGLMCLYFYLVRYTIGRMPTGLIGHLGFCCVFVALGMLWAIASWHLNKLYFRRRR